LLLWGRVPDVGFEWLRWDDCLACFECDYRAESVFPVIVELVVLNVAVWVRCLLCTLDLVRDPDTPSFLREFRGSCWFSICAY